MNPTIFPLVPILNILILVTSVSILARLFRVPYTVALVFSGLLTSFLPIQLPNFSPEIFLILLLPPVIFHDANHITLSELRENGKIIFSFAFIGTLISALLIAVISHFTLKFNFIEALLLGVIVSPTDPISVISTLQRLEVPRRLTLVIRGEALFNDGVAVVLYSALTTACVSGLIDITGLFSKVVFSILIGIVVGGLIGYSAYRLASIQQDLFIQLLLTFIAMYGSYQLVTYLKGCGIIGVAITGIFFGDFIRKVLPQRNLEDISSIWAFISFICSSMSFVLIGLNLYLPFFTEYLPMMVLGISIVLFVRAITVYGLTNFLNFRKGELSRNWQHVIFWSGLRGVVSVMLALGLTALPLQHAQEIIMITFGIVFFSILFQGMSIGFIVKKLKFQ